MSQCGNPEHLSLKQAEGAHDAADELEVLRVLMLQ